MAELSRADASLLIKTEASARKRGWLSQDERLLFADIVKLVSFERAVGENVARRRGRDHLVHRLIGRSTFVLCLSKDTAAVLGHGPASQYFSVDRIAAVRHLSDREFEIVVVAQTPCRYRVQTIGRNSAPRAARLTAALEKAKTSSQDAEPEEIFSIREAGRAQAVAQFSKT